MEKLTNKWSTFVKFITFVNLPIKKKFLLFGLGTLFWFILIGLVSISAFTFINFRYSQLSNTTLPYIQTIQKIQPKLEALKHIVVSQHEVRLQEEQLAKISLHVRQLYTIISQANIDVKNSIHGKNFIQSLTYSLAKDDPEGMKILQELTNKIKYMQDSISVENRFFTKTSSPQIWNRLLQDTQQIEKILDKFSARTEKMHKEYSVQMNKAIRFSVNSIAVIILIAIILLWFFTKWLTEAFSKPIESMIHQIHSIGTGEVDLSKKLKIKSQDEIGTLSKEFNKLVDTVYGVTVFKKVIEEDSSLDTVYTRLGEVFERDAKIDEYKIYEIDEAKQTMKVVYPPSFTDETLHCHDEILNNCSLCRAKKTAHTISSLEYSGICKQFIPIANKEHICIPLVIAGKPAAVIQFIFDTDKSDKEIEVIHEKVFKAQSYIKNSLSVIETKKLMHTLRESSLVDGLTGLYNRRFLQDHSNQIIAGVLRREKQISLLMCDMDFFKQVNDTYGHDAGDSILKETSAIFRNSVRKSDFVIRFGGEEFLILLVDTEPQYGYEVAEKIRKRVEEYSFKIPNGILKKTICIGISEFPKDTQGFWQAIKFADVALYKAKESGRNKCIRFTPELWGEKDNF